MKKDIAFYGKLFTATFTLSAFTFGGGYVIVPLMRKKFVEGLHWIDEAEILDLVAIAQCTPGSMAVNASILIGYRLAGIAGALVAILGTVLPPLLIISIISVGYTAFRDNAAVGRVLLGMQAGVAAVIASAVIGMAGEVMKQKRWLPICVMAGVLIASAIFRVNIIIIILLCGLVGLTDTLSQNRRHCRAEKGGETKE